MRSLLAVLILLILPAGAVAQEPPPEPVIPPGAKAAGLDIGGQTLSQAAATLDAAFTAQLAERIQVRVAGHRFTLSQGKIRFVFDPLKTARRANIAARSTPPQPDGTQPVDVPLYVTYDGERLATFTTTAGRRSRTRPRNAKLTMTLRRMKLRRAVMGWSIDEKA